MRIVWPLCKHHILFIARPLGVVFGLLLGLGGSASAGCVSDQECKGDRVCEQGQCVDPRLSGVGASCSKDRDCPGDLLCKSKQCVQAAPKDVPAGSACPGGDEFTPPGCVETDKSHRLREAHETRLKREKDDEEKRNAKARKERCEEQKDAASNRVAWPAAGFKDTELGVSMKPEVRHGATQVYARV